VFPRYPTSSLIARVPCEGIIENGDILQPSGPVGPINPFEPVGPLNPVGPVGPVRPIFLLFIYLLFMYIINSEKNGLFFSNKIKLQII
jgi:hypothetical protein